MSLACLPFELPHQQEDIGRKRRACDPPEWHDEPTYRIPDFFGGLKWHFRELLVVRTLRPPAGVPNKCTLPHAQQPSGRGTQVVFGTTEEKAILKKQGWPSSSHEKTACMDELKAYVAQQKSGEDSDDNLDCQVAMNEV